VGQKLIGKKRSCYFQLRLRCGQTSQILGWCGDGDYCFMVLKWQGVRPALPDEQHCDCKENGGTCWSDHLPLCEGVSISLPTWNQVLGAIIPSTRAQVHNARKLPFVIFRWQLSPFLCSWSCTSILHRSTRHNWSGLLTVTKVSLYPPLLKQSVIVSHWHSIGQA
jgi:hypothetical protein